MSRWQLYSIIPSIDSERKRPLAVGCNLSYQRQSSNVLLDECLQTASIDSIVGLRQDLVSLLCNMIDASDGEF